MKRNDIRKIYTQKVTELLNQGYTIYPDSMNGHQGEIAKIDLIRGSEIIRVLLESTLDYNTGWHDRIIRLTVGRAQQDGNYIRGEFSDTLWNQRLDIIEQHTWADIGEDRRHGDWYTDLDEARKIFEIRMARYRAAHPGIPASRNLGPAYQAIALRWLKKRPIRGMKSAKASDIEYMRRVDQHYTIRIKGQILNIG